jgi:hypothetical protein
MNQFISLPTAIEMTARFRTERNNILQFEYQDQNVLPLSETFDRSAIDTLLGKEGAVALRIYYGMDENLKIHAIIVASNENNEDLLAPMSLTATEEEDIVENGTRCPELCPEPSPLNL